MAQGAAEEEFKYVPAKRRSFYHFNSEPSATAKNEEKARMKMREQCGWASSVHRPYKPLGTPDLERAKASRLLRKQHPSSKIKGKQLGDDGDDKDTEFLMEDDEQEDNLGSHGNGYSSLKKEIDRSFKRMTACRTGASFMHMVQKDAPNDSVHYGSPGAGEGETALQIEPGSPTDSLPASGPPSPYSDPGMDSLGGVREYVIRKSPSKVQTLEQKMITGPEFLSDFNLDPSVTLMERLKEFDKCRNNLNRRLGKNLKILEHDRGEVYKRKFMAFKIHNTGFNGERWRLEAEKSHLESQLHAVDSHRWYSRFLELAQERGTLLSPMEKQVVEFVKSIVEEGRDFEETEFHSMVLGLPREAHTQSDVQKLVNFIRDEIGISVEEFRMFLGIHGLPISYQLNKQNVRGSPGAPGPRSRFARPQGGMSGLAAMHAANPMISVSTSKRSRTRGGASNVKPDIK